MGRLGVKMDLLTNLTFDVGEFVEKVDPRWMHTPADLPAYKHIRVSYHPLGKVKPEEIVRKAYILRRAGFRIGVFGLSRPDFLTYNMNMAEMCLEAKIVFFVKDFLGAWGGKLYGTYRYPDAVLGVKNGPVECRSREVLIGPDGVVYKCHRDLYAGEYGLGEVGSQETYAWRKCAHYGECNFCDAKLKTNRFLDAGQCAIEVRKG